MAKTTEPKPLFDPPAHLSDRAKALWIEIVPRRAKSPERIALVAVALESMDRADDARAAIASSGMVTTTKRTGVSHCNPLLKIERESRMLFARIWGQLNLSWTPEIDGRRSELDAIIARANGTK